MGGTSPDAFKAVYGNNFLFYRSRGGRFNYCNGGSAQRQITCSGVAPMSELDPVRLLVHELGHSVVQTRYPVARTPYTQVRELKMIVDGPDGPEWVTGTHPTWNDCQANRFPRECAATNQIDQTDPGFYRRFDRTERGYLSTLPPDMYHGSNWGDWRTEPGEDYADMFMNWVYNTFDSDDAGTQRYNFMEGNMDTWTGV